MSLEIVLLVPVLVLLTVFVLWAGRGGRAALTADLAAEEAVTAAALCCEEDDAGEEGREAMAAAMLESRPGLDYLCVDGPQPSRPTGGGQTEFVSEEWVEFGEGDGVRTGGVGVLELGFRCATDGAVAPLRGVFPTVDYAGQATEVVLRQASSPGLGFSAPRFEAAEGADNTLVFTVTLGSGVTLGQEVSVDYTIDITPETNTNPVEPGAAGDPSVPNDFEDPLGNLRRTVTIPMGESSAEIRFPLSDDDLYEGDESMRLTLIEDSVDPPDLVEVSDSRQTADGIITDDDPAPHVFLHRANLPCQVTEGGSLSFDVRLRNQADTEFAPSVEPATVNVATVDGTATAGSDYTAVNRTVTFAARDTNPTTVVQVATTDDEGSPEGEDSETFRLRLSSPTGAGLGSTSEVTCTILDDEARVSAAAVSAAEGSDMTFKITLDRAPAADVIVAYELEQRPDPPHSNRATLAADSNGNGTIDCDDVGDFLPLSGSHTFTSSGSREHDITVTTCDDDVPELAETLWLDLRVTAGEAVTMPPPANGAVGTITDNDQIVISADDVAADEGATLQFSVNLVVGGSPANLTEKVTLNYAITEATPASATQGDDYEAAPGVQLTGTLEFGPGTSAAQTLDVALLRDLVTDDGETFVLSLTNADAGNALGIAAKQATGTINDVPTPALSVSDAVAAEGSPLAFTVSLVNALPGETVTVDYRTRSLSASACQVPEGQDPPTSGRRCAPPVGDYLASSGRLRLSDTRTSATVNVATLTDLVAENNQTLQLTLSGQSPAHVGLADGVGIGTITNVNVASAKVNDVTAQEGQPLSFTISLVDDRDRPAAIRSNVTIGYSTADRTATAPADYTAVPARSHTFTPGGATTHTVTVTTATDTVVEGDETAALLLTLDPSSDAAALGDAEGIGTLRDVDPPRLFVEDASAREGEKLSFRVLLGDRTGGAIVPRPTSETVTFTAATENGTAAAPGDYTAVSSRVVRIAPGQTSATVEVQTAVDDVAEPPETMRLVLQDPRNAGLEDAVAVGTIRPSCIKRTDTAVPTISIEDATVAEGAATTELYVSLSRPLCEDFSLRDRYVEGTAICTDIDQFFQCGTPYEGDLQSTAVDAAKSELLRFPIRPSFIIPDDDLDEDDEQFHVELAWGADMPARFPKGVWTRATITIIDDDDTPSLRVSDGSASAGDTVTFDVSLSEASGKTVTVNYATADGTATAPADYTATSGTLTFAPGVTAHTVQVPTAANTDGETDERFSLSLSRPANATLADAVGVGTILAGDGPRLSIADAEAAEGATMSFAVTLSKAAAAAVTVRYDTQDLTAGVGRATAGADYVALTNGTLTFAPGELTQTISVTVSTDADDEPDEIFLVNLSNPSTGVSLADPSAVGTITGSAECVKLSARDTTPLPAMTLSGLSADENDGPMSITMTLATPLCELVPFTVDLAASVPAERTGRRATAGVDYLAVGTQFLPALEDELSFDVVLVDDNIHEGDEIFRVLIRDDRQPGNRDLPDVNGYPVIADDDNATLSVRPASASEGDPLDLVVRLDRPASEAVTVDWATSDAASGHAATAGEDYRARSGAVTIAAGRLSARVTVPTIEDLLHEYDEVLDVTISNPRIGGGLTAPAIASDGATATGTIRDDDLAPQARISDADADEGDPLVFKVSLDTASARTLTLLAATRYGGGDSARPGIDYIHTALQMVFAAGETLKTFSVPTLTDTVAENTERVLADLRGTQARLADNLGVGKIHDRSLRRLSVSNAAVIEGGAASFRVSIAGAPANRDITVAYSTSPGTATAADFTAATGTLTIRAGATSASVLVATTQDRLDEDVERFTLTLSNPTGAVLGVSQATGAIVDDDPLPRLSVDDPEASENGDSTPINFTISLSEASGRDVTVRYSTADLPNSAVAGSDYVAQSSQTATIAAGATSATVAVALVNDEIAEDVERFQLSLTQPANAGLEDALGVGTILDDDGDPQILIDDPADVFEGPDAEVSFSVRLSKTSAETITVQYATENATAASGSDFTAASGTLTFAAEEKTKTVTVSLVNDSTVEETETFRLVLSSPANATLGDGRAVATILDDDGLPHVSVADAAAVEGATATFTVRLSKQSARAATVRYRAVANPLGGDAAATPVLDFAAATGTLTVPARSTAAAVQVTLVDDALDEPDETFWLRLSEPTGSTVSDGTGVGTITDNDPLPQLSAGDARADEGDPLAFAVTLDAASARTVTVPWATAGVSSDAAATPGNDYVNASGTLTFEPGVTSASVSVSTIEDSTDESDEIFQVRLGTPTHAAVDDGVGVGRIIDDDNEPKISIADVTVVEDAGPAQFTVTLSRTTSKAVTVTYTLADGTAERPGDYDFSEETRTLVIPAGLTTGQIAVFIVDDEISEGDETFTVSLSNPVNGVIESGAGSATGTITDNEPQPALSIADARAREGDGTITFTVSLSKASADDVTVRYATFDSSAKQPGDYIATAGTLTIAAGNRSGTITVTLIDDPFVELDKLFRIRLSAPTAAELDASLANGVVLDDDRPPVLSIELPEGGVMEDDGSFEGTLTLSHPLQPAVRVLLEIQPSIPSHCPSVTNRETRWLTLPAGATGAAFTVTLVDNDEVCSIRHTHEHRINPTFENRYNWVRLTASSVQPLDDSWTRPRGLPWADYGPGGNEVSHELHVWDDDDLAYVSICGGTTIDGGAFHPSVLTGVLESADSVPFDICLSHLLDEDVVVVYKTRDPQHFSLRPFKSRATPGTDYTAVSAGTVTIAAGQSRATINVPIIDDSTAEPAEGFEINLRSVKPNADDEVIAELRPDRSDTGNNVWNWIVDDDTLPELAVTAKTAAEGESARFEVTMSRISASDVTVAYATADGTTAPMATAPADYTASTGTLTIKAGQTQAAILVSVVDDEVIDPNETFTLTLSGPTGATLATASATATIVDNDGVPTVSVRDAWTAEGQSATVTFVLSEASAQVVTVKAQPVYDPSLGEYAASAGDGGHIDYDASRDDPLSGPWVYFRPGQLSATRLADAVQDNLPERDERYVLALHSPTNAAIGDGQAWITIIDDDLPIVTVSDVTVSESAAHADLTLTLHAAGVEPGSLRYSTLTRPSVGDAAARPGEDYIHTTGMIDIAAGTTSARIRVPLIGDSTDEFDESFLVQLSSPDGLEFDKAIAVVTLLDDDDGWTINDRSVSEGAGSMSFSVARDHTSASAVTVSYTVSGVLATAGVSCSTGVDFVTPPGSVTLAPTAKTATISVTVCDDTAAEGRETFLVELTGVTGRRLTGTGTIVDND